ncbi:MAG: fimbrillin family protein [Alistipes sp.]|nr:fimbrillin family protein [Alistipes sp.]
MKTKYLYIISALTLGLVSCHEGDVMPNIECDRTMSFNVVGSNAQTRVQNDIFEAEDKIGVYVTDYIDDETPAPLQVSGNRANNEGVVYDGEKWAAERPIYWGEGKSDVYAYYPYIDNVTDVDEQPFSIATDQDAEGAYEASDLLWAKTEGVAESDGAVQLEMKHTMSRLVVRIMAGEDYKGSLPKDATVHLHSTVTDVLFSFDSGSVVKNPYAGAKSIKMHNLGIRTFADGEAVVYEAIVAPQMLLGTVPLLEINSKSVSYLLEDSFNFKPSTSYTYTAVLNSSTTSIKIDIGCEMDDWNNLGGGSGDNEGDEGGNEGDIDLSGYTDLSAEGTANCYLVQAAGNYKFKATVGNTESSVGNVKKTEVLWETFGTDVMPNEGDLIASTGYQNGYIYFSTAENFNNGNASIAARNSKDVILWSWHIWCSEEGWNDHVYANNAGTMMDRNLGATSATPGDVGALGLLYQWGRKDPFLGICSLTEEILAASTGSWNTVSGRQTISYAEANPTTFVTGEDWGSENGEDYVLRWQDNKKSLYDPCPVGYRVPDGGENGFWVTAKVKSSADLSNHGIYWTLADGETTAWYPAVGYRTSDGVLDGVGTRTYYWSASPYSLDYYDYYVHAMYINGEYVNPASDITRGNGCSVRCVKE